MLSSTADSLFIQSLLFLQATARLKTSKDLHLQTSPPSSLTFQHVSSHKSTFNSSEHVSAHSTAWVYFLDVFIPHSHQACFPSNNNCLHLSVQWASPDTCFHGTEIYWWPLYPYVLNATADVSQSHTALPAAHTDWHWGAQTWAHGIPQIPVHTEKHVKERQLHQGAEGGYELWTEHTLTYTRRTHTWNHADRQRAVTRLML